MTEAYQTGLVLDAVVRQGPATTVILVPALPPTPQETAIVLPETPAMADSPSDETLFHS